MEKDLGVDGFITVIIPCVIMGERYDVDYIRAILPQQPQEAIIDEPNVIVHVEDAPGAPALNVDARSVAAELFAMLADSVREALGARGA